MGYITHFTNHKYYTFHSPSDCRRHSSPSRLIGFFFASPGSISLPGFASLPESP
ncbi:unnamed protein product [Linum tenue]|uniref:Uncharacterized protein n=1 Tax=Linum tenue TaxID=586396 RepID=A0AAV0K6Y0_9ROSI|nr:unnamed protein product [Linum tenue]